MDSSDKILKAQETQLEILNQHTEQLNIIIADNETISAEEKKSFTELMKQVAAILSKVEEIHKNQSSVQTVAEKAVIGKELQELYKKLGLDDTLADGKKVEKDATLYEGILKGFKDEMDKFKKEMKEAQEKKDKAKQDAAKKKMDDKKAEARKTYCWAICGSLMSILSGVATVVLAERWEDQSTKEGGQLAGGGLLGAGVLGMIQSIYGMCTNWK